MNEVIPKNEEFIYSGSVIISQTDLDGVITFVNRKFCKVSGYKIDELIGMDHSMVVHPDMPKIVFSKMWETINGGQAWNGLVKNLRADGLFYWVALEILPNKDDDENITGFISVGKPASDKDIQENKELYSKMLETQGV